MKQKCICGRVWILEMVTGERDRKARTIHCDCGEILITAFGNVDYKKHIAGAHADDRDHEPLAHH